MNRAVAMLSYEDVGTAVAWLEKAFGFTQRGEAFTDDEGRITQVELERDGAVVMLGWPGPEYRGPRRHAETCDDARSWLDVPWVVDGVFVEVDDVDAHAERAVAAGATILRGPETIPFGRLYTAEDLEGHRWMFMRPADDRRTHG
jgi:PhnB protein